MSLRVRLLFNFPYFKVLALSIILALLGLASIVLSALGFVREIWGHYVGSGIWCGTFVFVTGICGVAAAHWKGIYSVRLFLGTSIVSCFLSVAELGLSAGGLDYNSDFYIKRVRYAIIDHGPTKLIHGLLLMISILQFALSLTCAFICAYHACFKKYVKTRTPATTGQSTKRFLRSSSRSSNVSTGSRAPLHTVNDENKRKRRKRPARLERNDQNNIENNHPDSRPLLRESQHKPPDQNRDRRNENENSQRRQRSRPRSSSRPRREPIEIEAEHIQRVQDEDIVIENTSPKDTVPQFVALQPVALVCSYYNDEPPIPIDEDDELPPYEEVIRDAECENDSMVNGSRSGTYDSETRGRSSCTSYDHSSTNSSGSSTTYSNRRNILGLQKLLISPENHASRTLTENSNPNNFINANVTTPFVPPLPPKLATPEREAFLKDFWLSDYPQGISYCGFSRNDCPVKENIPRADRTRSFHRQQSREREFVKQNVLDTRRHSNMENGNVDGHFGNKNQFFKDYVKSQPNIRGKLHDSRTTSASSVCSLPSDNPPPKPPRLYSFESPIKLELKDQSNISVKNQNTNLHISRKDNGSTKTYANVDMCGFENSSKIKSASKHLYMNLEDLSEKQSKRQEIDSSTSITDKNQENTNCFRKPLEDSGRDKPGNVDLVSNLKLNCDFSQPIGHSTPKSSLMMPSSPGLSPIETSKPVVQPQTETPSCINRVAKEEFAKLEDSPKIFNFKSLESKTMGNVAENLKNNKSDKKRAANEDQFNNTTPPKLEHTKSPPKIEDKLSLRPYLIRDDGKRRSVGNVRSDLVDEMNSGEKQEFSTCAPSPEIKYLTKNSGHTHEQQTDTKEPYRKNQRTKHESKSPTIQDEKLNTTSARKQLFSPESKHSKLPVLTLRPLHFDFKKDLTNKNGDSSQSLNKKHNKHLNDDKDKEANSTLEDWKPDTSRSDTSEEEQDAHQEEEEASSSQQSQNSSTSDGHKKPIYSILL